MDANPLLYFYPKYKVVQAFAVSSQALQDQNHVNVLAPKSILGSHILMSQIASTMIETSIHLKEGQQSFKKHFHDAGFAGIGIMGLAMVSFMPF